MKEKFARLENIHYFCSIASTCFMQKDFQPYEAHTPTPEVAEAHSKLRNAVLEHSRKTMSHVIARYVWIAIKETS